MATVELDEVSFDPFVIPTEPVKRWTVSEYHELIKAGVLSDDAPYELLEGWLVTKMTKNPPHERTLSLLNKWIPPTLPTAWECRTQHPITLSDGEPEPDLAIVSAPLTQYGVRHPIAAEIALIIEVANSSLYRDRGIKLRSYSRAGIQEYWIVNLIEGVIEVYTQPMISTESNIPTYAPPKIFRPGEMVPLVVGGQKCAELSVDDIIG